MTGAAPRTAGVGFQPAGLDLRGRMVRGTYHAVLTGEPVRNGFVTRHRGEALCGAAPLGDCPPALFLAVDCPACLAIAAREQIQVETEEAVR